MCDNSTKEVATLPTILAKDEDAAAASSIGGSYFGLSESNSFGKAEECIIKGHQSCVGSSIGIADGKMRSMEKWDQLVDSKVEANPKTTVGRVDAEEGGGGGGGGREGEGGGLQHELIHMTIPVSTHIAYWTGIEMMEPAKEDDLDKSSVGDCLNGTASGAGVARMTTLIPQFPGISCFEAFEGRRAVSVPAVSGSASLNLTPGTLTPPLGYDFGHRPNEMNRNDASESSGTASASSSLSASSWGNNFETSSSTRMCENCQTTVTPFWRRAVNGLFYCNACGLYLRAHNRMRPVELQINRAGKKIKTRADVCINCQARETPLWRRISTGETVCNACGLYFKLHGTHRSVEAIRNGNATLPNGSNGRCNGIGSKPRALLPKYTSASAWHQYYPPSNSTSANMNRNASTSMPHHRHSNEHRQHFQDFLQYSSLINNHNQFAHNGMMFSASHSLTDYPFAFAYQTPSNAHYSDAQFYQSFNASSLPTHCSLLGAYNRNISSSSLEKGDPSPLTGIPRPIKALDGDDHPLPLPSSSIEASEMAQSNTVSIDGSLDDSMRWFSSTCLETAFTTAD